MLSGFTPVVIDLRPSEKATIPWDKLNIPAELFAFLARNMRNRLNEIQRLA